MKTVKLSAQADLFIIPNKCSDVVDANGKVLNHRVQVWIPVFEGWDNKNSENIIDHGLDLRDGKFVQVRGSVIDATPFLGKKEGEFVTLTLPAYVEDGDDEEKVMIELKVRLNQSDYRYRSFGKFEDVLESMIA